MFGDSSGRINNQETQQKFCRADSSLFQVCLEEVENAVCWRQAECKQQLSLCSLPKGDVSNLSSLLLQGFSAPTQPCQPALPWNTPSWATCWW